MAVTERDIRALADILRAAARQEIMPRFRSLGEDGVRTKTSAIDLVTDADEQAERMIEAALRKSFPGALVIGEEAVSADPAKLVGIADADLAFIVDPVDGTANFAAGLPLFGVMAAILVRGEIAGAVILDPITDACSYGLRGEGAWWEAADGRRRDMTVAAPVALDELIGTVSWHWTTEPTRSVVTRNLPRLGAAFCYRCCAHEYRLLATGDVHFGFYSKMMPWDHAPGWLLHREAGGYSARFDGLPYTPARSDGGLIAAPDRATWQVLHDALLTPLEHQA